MNIKPIGIDLGTTFSAVATINEAGKPEIVPNSEGNRITASAVYFETKKDIHVGQIAVDKGGDEPDRVVRFIKRQMGNKDYNFKIDGRSYTPEEISSFILKKITQDASVLLPGVDTSKVVITVPAYFDEFRRKATMDAAKKAGLEVLRIINEPTAAALAYASQGSILGKTLIYDFGGGTFDVSIVDIKSHNEVEVLSSEGDHQLGGYDIDILIGKHLAKEYCNDLMPEKASAVRHNTIVGSEKMKKDLSRLSETKGLFDNGMSFHELCKINKELFNNIISETITRTEMLVELALDQASLKVEDIDNVLLVGGTTRIPRVKEMLKLKFNKDPISSINPDEAVVLGAAIQAGVILAHEDKSDLSPVARKVMKNTNVSDVSAHSFGTLVVDQVTGRLRNVILIPKNSPLPASKSEDFETTMDNQITLDCKITQGEDEDPEFVSIVKEGDFELPSGRRAGCQIRVTYIYDVNGRMSCNFHDIGSGNSKVFSLDSNENGKEEVAFDDSDFDDFEIN